MIFIPSEQDNDAREADACAVSATCLQASQDIPSSYLQCDQTWKPFEESKHKIDVCPPFKIHRS
ncbi:hypothetical protein NECAME_19358 [Necator americanus]|uniref:Uncharacterized protein n=1 Tax=Necator americanus TaxID=51031 RepID=W2SP34_NECAM|nr:hypothetical protein NECAME_19358 [Necator americanus]ETN71405.1 hypothetical protein NECAME_19358 [Necator americanus]